MDRYGDPSAREVKEQTQPTDTNPWRSRGFGGFDEEGAEGGNGRDWRNRGSNNELDDSGDGGYAGDREPSPSAAFEPGSSGIAGKAAVGAQGQDGKLWKRGG